MGGLILVSQATLGFKLGIAAAWYFAGFALGLVFLGLCVAKMKKIAVAQNFLTLSDYFQQKFDAKNRILSALIIFLALFALLVGQFIAAGSLFSPLLQINYAVAVLLMMASVLAYLVLGGFKAVIRTDLLQFLIMAVIFGSLLFVIDIGQYTPAQINVSSVGGSYIVLFLLLGIFTALSGADIWQRVFAAKNVRTARRASFLSALLFFIFGTVLTIIGLAARNNFPNIKPEEALYYGLFHLIPLPLLGIAVVFVLAAIMSTIDTELFYLSSSLAKDFSRSRNASEAELARSIRRYILVLALVSALVAIFFSNILTIAFGIVSLSLAVSPALVASLFWRIKNNAAFLSMLAGLLSLLILVATGNFNPDNSIITLPAALVFLAIGQLVCKRKTEGK